MENNLVYIISPYAGAVKQNLAFAAQCCRLAIAQNLTPIAVHMLYPQILNDIIPEERSVGLKLGLDILRHCGSAWVCGSRISQGMRGEIQEAQRLAIPIRYVEEAEVLQGVNCKTEIPGPSSHSQPEEG